MKVVLSGYYGFDNAGDEAILQTIIYSLRRIRPTIEIVVLSHQPEKTANTYHVQAVNRWKIKEVYRAINMSDGLISGGGSLLQDVTSKKPVLYYTGIMFIAKLCKKPYFIYAQGMGPISTFYNHFLVKKAVNGATTCSVRDSDSA